MAFFDIITKMDETVASQKSNETLGSGLKRMALFLAIIGLLVALGISIVSALLPVFGTGGIVGGIVIAIILLIGIVVGGLVFSLISSGLTYVFARMLGGKGEFGRQYGVSTMILFPFLALGVVTLIFYLGLLVPLLGIVFIIPMYFMLGFLGALANYFSIVYLKAVHGLDTFKSALTIGLALAALMILLIIAVAAIVL